jgi:membrane protease YdiL (CAAX protease family)
MSNLFTSTSTRHASLLKVTGPVVISAFSIFVTFCLLQPLACWLDPSFTLLANRSVGKIAFTLMVLLHILLLATTTSRTFFNRLVSTNILFLVRERWLRQFFTFFALFAGLHTIALGVMVYGGYVTCTPEAALLIIPKIPNLLWGFVATFFLAWTEEFIFRGTLYPFFAQRFAPLASITLTSLIFSLAHDLTNPLSLITTQWRLGLGLFLLGFMLNLLFALTGKLYIGMGAHAGLVYIKVLLRRIPLITIPTVIPWWFSADLRQSIIIHILFALAIVGILLWATLKTKESNI